jgi:hypothetical protein
MCFAGLSGASSHTESEYKYDKPYVRVGFTELFQKQILYPYFNRMCSFFKPKKVKMPNGPAF